MSKRAINVIDFSLLLLIGVYLLYTVWFQYAVYSLNSLLTLVGIGIAFFSIFKIGWLKEYYTNITPIFLFLLIAFVSSLIGENFVASIHFFIQIVKYCIPLLGIYVYVGDDSKKLFIVIKIVAISSILISTSSFFKDVYYLTYDDDLQRFDDVSGLMNPNLFSSYMMLGMASIICLYFFEEKKKTRLFLVLFIGLEMVAQLNAASRRGIVVCVILIVAFIHTLAKIKYKNDSLTRLGITLIIIVGIIIIMNEITVLSDHFVGVQRLFGNKTGGDEKRRIYQKVAFNIFKTNPICGKGLGAVAQQVGMYSHSLYYELLACTGAVGLVMVLSYLIKTARQYLRLSVNSNFSDAVMSIARIGFWFIIALLITGVAVVLIYDSYFYISLGIIASSLNVINSLSSSQIKPAKYRQKR